MEYAYTFRVSDDPLALTPEETNVGAPGPPRMTSGQMTADTKAVSQ